MSNNQRAACDWATSLENFAAELTSAVYPLVLRRGPKDSWLKMELGLWRALAETVKMWSRHRPPRGDLDEFKLWREALLLDLTESAVSVAVNNGVRECSLDLELGLYRTFCLMIRRDSYVRRTA